MSDTKEVRVTGLRMIAEPEGAPRKDQTLAIFEFEHAGMHFNDCALVKFKNGNIRIFPPRVERNVVIYIQDDSLREAITEAAHRAYVALGGSA